MVVCQFFYKNEFFIEMFFSVPEQPATLNYQLIKYWEPKHHSKLLLIALVERLVKTLISLVETFFHSNET